MPANNRARQLAERMRDERSRRVVFLAHCLLNENTRYLGGACRAGCVREIVQQCLDRGIGIVQLPCPEQAAWGGVLNTMTAIDPETLSLDRQNTLVREHVIEGRGIFMDELQRALRRRHLDVPFSAHDLFAELDGRASTVAIHGSRSPAGVR